MSTQVEVAVIPTCDIHGMHYDARVYIHGRWVWANVCEQAFVNGQGSLGTGRGQRLILKEKPDETD